MMLLRNLSLILLGSLLLVGCNSEKTRNLIDQRRTEAEQGVQGAYTPAPPKPYNPLSVSDKVWAGKSALRMHRGIPLPAKYEGSRGVTIVAADPMNLTEIAGVIGSQTGTPVRIAPGTEQTGSTRGSSRQAAAAEVTMPLAYEGPLSGLLDMVCGYYNINWKYDGSSIYLSRFETRVFMIESLPGTQTVKEGMKEDENSGSGTGSSGSSGSSDLQQTSQMNLELKVWEELGQTITALLGGTGNAVVAPSSGTITVTTTPEIMRQVSMFISAENKRLSQQIAINIEVYTVSLSDSTDFNVSFNTALNFMGGSYSGGNSAAAVTGGGALSLAIFNPKHVKSATSLFTALTKIGDATRVAQFPLTTLNNRPVSRRVGRDISYVQSVTNNTSTTSTGLSNSAVTPGTIREGFSIQVTPRVLDDGRIMLQYSLSLIDVTMPMKEFDSGDATIQLPEASTRIFVQQSMLKSGSTLVIGGYDDEKASQGSEGVGNAFNYLLGGGVSNSTTRAMMFIAITPQVLDSQRSEQE